jgi:hypothetical protein
MVQIQNSLLDAGDVKYIREYAKFVLNRFVPKSVLKTSLIRIRIIHPKDLVGEEYEDAKSVRAWCMYQGVFNEKRTFDVTLTYTRYNKSAKQPLTRLKKILIDLGHELIHVKQYLNNEIFDYKNGFVRYKGKEFDDSYKTSLENYFESPWEVEAYGREYGLFRIYEQLKRKGDL